MVSTHLDHPVSSNRTCIFIQEYILIKYLIYTTCDIQTDFNMILLGLGIGWNFSIDYHWHKID